MNFKKFSIKSKLLLNLFLLGIPTLAGLVFFITSEGTSRLQEEIFQRLISIREIKKQQIILFSKQTLSTSNDVPVELLQEAGMGETGEIVLGMKLDGKITFINPLRFDPEAAFERTVEFGSQTALPIQAALATQTGSGISKDYRGKTVFAAWTYIPQFKWGMVIKMDQEEALSPIYQMRDRILFIGIWVLLLISGIFYWLTNSLSKRAKRIAEQAVLIANGRFLEEQEQEQEQEQADELAKISEGLVQISESFRKITETATLVSAGDYTHTLQKRNAEDRMVEAINQMSANLLQKSKEHKIQQEKIEARNLDLEQAQKDLLIQKNALDESAIVSIADVQGRITYANDKFCEISKYSREELLGQNHRIVKSDYHPNSYFKEMWQTIARGKIWRGDFKNKAKDGSIYWVSSTLVPILNEAGKPIQYLGVRFENTKKKMLEEELIAHREHLEDLVETRTKELKSKQAQLIQASKLTSLGEMATGMAHELNTPLNVILLSAHEATDLLEDKEYEEIEETQKRIRRQVERCSKIINHLRAFGRDEAQFMSPVALNQLLDETLLFFNKKLANSNIELQRETPENLPPLHGDANQVEQVFINIFNNAIDALENREDAKITVSAAVLSADNRNDRCGMLEIRFADNGGGMPEEVRKKIFEPFFTTKDIGKGTGLGLSISHGIIVSHNGSIECESVPDEGSTFIITLPLSE